MWSVIQARGFGLLLILPQEEKPDAKDVDVEMKGDESAAKHGDVSPIALAEDAKTSGKRKEPSSEELSNFARVTPAQLAYLSFSSASRYQPVRPVSARAAGKGKARAEKYAGGGGILILEDRTPEEPAEYLAFETQEPLPQAPSADGATSGSNNERPHLALDENEPEAEVPAPFEYPFGSE
jgi:26S proteasome regulatory subunit N2